MRVFVLTLLVALLSACSTGIYIPEDATSEYEEGLEYCAAMETVVRRHDCEFHFEFTYGEKYSANWADFSY